jgi:hypothetical protein
VGAPTREPAVVVGKVCSGFGRRIVQLNSRISQEDDERARMA